MLDKIILGTANFTQKYGMLMHKQMDQVEVKNILNEASANRIKLLDTAFSYGEFKNIVVVKKFTIITKFSVLEDYVALYKKLKNYVKKFDVYGLLVHDPQNLAKINRKDLVEFFSQLKQEKIVQKIGVSVYDLNEAYAFGNIYIPDIIQIPLNPLNQRFNIENFKKYVSEHNVEVHARSLFLQGILLASKLPTKLSGLKDVWQQLQEQLSAYTTNLEGLINWAAAQNWVNNWVLGVSSAEELKKIIHATKSVSETKNHYFICDNHMLADPRNWD